MNWLTVPAGLVLAAIIIPPLVLLYFLKLRRRTQPIASTLLWKRSVEDLRANTPFQKLRRNLLLLLQLLALVLLALAVMQPQIQAGRRSGGKNVVLVDCSGSMSAQDGGDGRSRLEEAKRRARELIEAIYGRGLFSQSAGQTMVIAFSDRAEVISPFTDSRPQLLAAIDRIQPTHGGSRIGDALTLARAYTTNVDPEAAGQIGDPAALELFSDGRIQDLADQVLRGETLTYHPIGSPDADNVAFTAISIERPYDRPTAVEVFAAIANFNEQPVTADIQLSVDGTARAIEEIAIGAAERDAASGLLVPRRQDVLFRPFELPGGAVIEVANLRADALAADNAVRLVVPPPRRLAVALVGSSGFLLTTVLEGIGLIQSLASLEPAEFEQRAQSGSIDDYDVVIFDNFAPPAGLMPPGRYLTFGVTPPLEGLNDYGEGKGQLVLDVDDQSPLFRFVNLEQLFISKSRLIQPAEGVRVLAEGSAGPVVVAVERGATQAVCVTFDPLDSNWPFQRGFVTFIVNAVDYLGHAGEAASEGSLGPGEALTALLPAGADKVKLLLPGSADPIDVPAADPAVWSWGPIRLSGVYQLTWESGGEDQVRLFAVNPPGDPEGDVRTAEKILARETGVAVAAAGGRDYMPLWPWAVGLCLAVMMLEWWVYHRKAYI